MDSRLDFRYSIPRPPDGPVVELSAEEAEKMLLKNLDEAKADPTEALWRLAHFYKQAKQHEKALERLRQLMQRLPDPEQKAQCVLTMGQAMEQVGDYPAAVRYYKDPAETGTHIGRIWAADGTPIASVTFSGESASGWQQQALTTPITLSAGTTYVVSVGYNAAFGTETGGLNAPYVTGPLASVADGANGVYATEAGTFPSSSWRNSNYYVDVVVQ